MQQALEQPQASDRQKQVAFMNYNCLGELMVQTKR
jgi:hypothetical protein